MKKGGVTRIIELQIKSLLAAGFKKENIKILCGHLPKQNKIDGIEIIVEKELDYLYREETEDLILHEHLIKLSNLLRKSIGKNDIIHVHNYGLGKNPIFTIAISQMINDGYRVLNHCHDFAEDRPANMDYLEAIIKDHFNLPIVDILYPIRKYLIYGVINRSDRERLYESGIPENDICYLPNPVDSLEFEPFSLCKNKHRDSICKIFNLDQDDVIITYPVRVIRRKNIEELLLLSILFKEKVKFIVTLPPENPIEIEYYQYWKGFSLEHDLPVIFDASSKIDFRKLIAGSDFCITTSVMEGFGMTFLEPWLTNTPVIGRDIPFVTNDFREIGLIFTSLYKNIIIKNMNGKDFKDLNREEATKTLLDLIDSGKNREIILKENPEIETLINKESIKYITKNKGIIIENYSILNYGKKLNEIYKRLSK